MTEVRSIPATVVPLRPSGRVVYLCQWTGTSGGIQVIYEHVRLLRRLGVPAMLGSHGAFTRCDWFGHDPAEIPAMANCLGKLNASDTLIVPDVCVGAPELHAVRCRRVAFVQNPSLLAASLQDYAFAMVPSRELLPWLARVAPEVRETVFVPGFLHEDLVREPRTFRRDRIRILIVDRRDKHRGEPSQAYSWLRQQPNHQVTLVTEAMSRSAFTDLFRRHDVYLHLSYPEGFPISVLEAFGAGCLVIGFAGCGGLEFMRDRKNCFVVADGDVAATVKQLDDLAATPQPFLDGMLNAARTTARSYDEQGTMAALAKCLGLPPNTPSA